MKKIFLSLILLLSLTAPSWAVVSSTISQNEYACNSSNTAWNYTFPIILSTDIYVYTIDSSGNLYPQTSNFSVNTYTQTVTYPVTGTPCATGYSILLIRIEPLTQQVAASNQGPSPSPVVMGMSDKLTMISQQLSNSSVQSSPGGGIVTLPPDISGMLLGWNGSALVNYAPNTSTYLAQATTVQAQAGTNNTAYMTPYLVGQQVGHAGAVSIPQSNQASGANSAITSLTGLTTPLSTGQGGTGSTANANATSGVVVLDSSSRLPAVSGALLTSIPLVNQTSQPYVKASETETSGTPGQTSLSTGSWLILVLNYKDSDDQSIATLCTGNATPIATCTGANQIVLPAGTYKVFGRVPFVATNTSQSRLFNVTGNASLIIGASVQANQPTVRCEADSIIQGKFTLSVPSAISVEGQISINSTGSFIGYNASFGTEVYTTVEFIKTN